MYQVFKDSYKFDPSRLDINGRHEDKVCFFFFFSFCLEGESIFKTMFWSETGLMYIFVFLRELNTIHLKLKYSGAYVTDYGDPTSPRLIIRFSL